MKKHAKHLLPPVDDALQARFDEGHAFEAYAEALFPDLKRLGFDSYQEYAALPRRTTEAWRSGASTVAQGRYEAGELTCITDILRRDDEGFELIEIKSGTSAKEEHEFDLAFQKVVLEEAGYAITRCLVAHANKEYVRSGEVDPSKLVAFTDISEKVEERLDNTRVWIEQAL